MDVVHLPPEPLPYISEFLLLTWGNENRVGRFFIPPGGHCPLLSTCTTHHTKTLASVCWNTEPPAVIKEPSKKGQGSPSVRTNEYRVIKD